MIGLTGRKWDEHFQRMRGDYEEEKLLEELMDVPEATDLETPL